MKVLLGGLDGFLSKVIAFIGEIPISTEGTSVEKPKNETGNNGNSFFLLFIYHFLCICVIYNAVYSV